MSNSSPRRSTTAGRIRIVSIGALAAVGLAVIAVSGSASANRADDSSPEPTVSVAATPAPLAVTDCADDSVCDPSEEATADTAVPAQAAIKKAVLNAMEIAAADDGIEGGDGTEVPDGQENPPPTSEPTFTPPPQTHDPVEEIGHKDENPIATNPAAERDSGAQPGAVANDGQGKAGAANKGSAANRNGAGSGASKASTLPKTGAGAPVGWLTVAAVLAMASGAVAIAARRKLRG